MAVAVSGIGIETRCFPKGSHWGFPRHWLLARDVDSCRRGPILYQEICSRVLKDNSDPAIFHLVVNNKISCTSTNLACNYLLDILRFFNPPLSCFPRWKWLSGLGGTWTSTKKSRIRSFEHLKHVAQKSSFVAKSQTGKWNTFYKY